jgi:hypothetical protein
MTVDQTKLAAGTGLIAYRKPHDSANALPALAAYGVPWTGYTDVGYTRDGLHFRLNLQRTNIEFDQSTDPVLRLPTTREVGVSTRLGEITGTNLQTAMSLGAADLVTVAPGAGTRGSDTLTVPGGTPVFNYYTVGFEVQGQDAEALQVLLKRGLIEGDVSLDFVKNDAALINFNVGAVPDTGGGNVMAIFRDVIAAA